MAQHADTPTDVLIVGAGLAGLCAALHLKKYGYRVKVLEAEDRPGGRIKTDHHQGFLLDRGFQVLLTAYPETREMLDYEALELRAFLPGALILGPEGKFEIMDPIRQPAAAFKTLFSQVGTLGDKLKILKLSQRLKHMSLEEIFMQPEKTTLAVIQEYGFSERMLRNFFQPFMAGIFLENGLTTSRREFDFVFKMFSEGDTAVPARGMEMIPKQLASRLGEQHILCNQKVTDIDGQKVTTADGSIFEAPMILIATEETGFVGKFLSDKHRDNQYHSTTNIYYSADRPPIKKGVIGLNARGDRLVNNVCVMNQVSADYAPAGKQLVSVSINGYQKASDEELNLNVRDELSAWFGAQPETWEHLRTYRVKYALPNQDSVMHEADEEEIKLRDGLYAAGDYLLNGSINAAMRSGRIAADVIKEQLVSA
jgi:phytoene dehydrogenase-like protein